MIAGLAVVVAALGGGLAGWWLARRRPAGGVREVAEPRLLPDPALDWLRRAHGALGVWVAELDPDEEGPRAERIVDAERLSVSQIVAVDRRLERARDGEESGSERLEGGTLVFQAEGGTAVGVLLPGQDGSAREAQVADDLRRLLKGMQAKPQLVAQAQARTREASFESAASIGLRLAYQIERILTGHGLAAEVAVAAAEPAGVRIVGVSGRADRRLLDAVLPEDCELARAARGGLDEMTATADPLAGSFPDRRQRVAAAVLLPMRAAAGSAVGAGVVWGITADDLTAAVRTEVREALANAAPRLARALSDHSRASDANVDALTGLFSRRALERTLAGHDAGAGALIGIDLDRFKSLNDELGAAAGDAALVHVARLLQDQIRAGDVAARVGGEEFALWLPGTDLDVGVLVAERVRIKIGTTPWAWQGRSRALAVSCGVAGHQAGVSPQVVIGQVNAAIEVAKLSGRNRVEKTG
jgi:diguanylate cyclase (GGDEF)-like protein